MAKLKYNPIIVNDTINELGVASNQLIDTEADMRSALTIIANARGIHHVHTDTLFNTLGFPTACQEMIEDTITSLKNRASEIEEYNQKYENASFLEKLGSTAGLFLTKICEGFASAGEQIIDGFASVIGLGAGLISKDAQNSIANFIKKDHVGDFFGNLYDNSLKDMVIKSWASEKGLACNIFKGVGTGIGYAAALYATGALAGGLSTGTAIGAKAGASALLTSLPASATVAGVAGLGAGTQAGLKGGWDYNDALAYGIKYGAIQAGTTIVFTYAMKGLSKGWNMLKNKMSGNAKPTGAAGVNNPGVSGGTTGGNTAGTPATQAPVKSGVTFKSPYKGYTCLDDVWDDVVAGKLTKVEVRDILKNTIGIKDSGLGHTFYSEVVDALKGKAIQATPRWKVAAAELSSTTIDDAASTIASNLTNSKSTTSTISSMADETFTASNSSAVQDVIESTTSPGTNAVQEVVETTSKSNLGNIKSSMERISESLPKLESNVTLAQQQLDDAIASGADDSVIASLQKNVTKAQNTYNAQLDKLKIKQQAYVSETASGKYNAIGTEKYKLINGEFIDDINSNSGNVTTLQVQTPKSNGIIETRANFTNATAMKEGQINANEFAKLLDKQHGPAISTNNPALAITVVDDALPPAVVAKQPAALTIVDDALPPAVVTPPTPTPVPTPVPGTTSTGPTIFGVVPPKEVVPPSTVVIEPSPVDPVIIPEPIVDVPPTIETPPIITPPPITETPPIVTPTPEPVIPTPEPVIPTPSPDLEYAPIPNTGIGNIESNRVGIAPIIAGAVAGIAGVVGGSLLKNKDKKSKDDEIEELEMESEE